MRLEPLNQRESFSNGVLSRVWQTHACLHMLKEDLSCWFMLMMSLLLPRLKMTLTGSTRSCPVDSMPRIWGKFIKSSVYESTVTGRTIQFTLIKSNTSAQSSNDLVSLRAHMRARRSLLLTMNTCALLQMMMNESMSQSISKPLVVLCLQWSSPRPDIAFVLGKLAQYMSDPSEHHGHALKSLM